MHGLQAPWSQVTSARGLAETGSREGGEAAENYPDLLNHEWHHSRGTSARSADCVHNPGDIKFYDEEPVDCVRAGLWRMPLRRRHLRPFARAGRSDGGDLDVCREDPESNSPPN